MSINYQIHNIFHQIESNNAKLIVNYAKSNSLYDLSLSNLDNYIFIDHKTIIENSITYGLTLISNLMLLANNAQTLKNMYSNKIIFMHDNVVTKLKKEDQYILLNSVKNYDIYSFLPDQYSSYNIKYLKYGFTNSAMRNSQDRPIDVLLLYNTEKKQTETLFQIIKQIIPKTDIACVKNITSNDMAIDLFNNTKVCIDLSSYYNLLMSVSCGCIGICPNQSYDPDFIFSTDSINSIINISPNIVKLHNDNYIQQTQKYISEHFSYTNYVDNISSIFNTHINTEVSL